MLEETLKSIRTREYQKAVEAILAARKIVIYSVENSVCTASDLMTKLLYLGLDCRMYGDYYLQNVSAGNLGREDLAIGISYSGYSRHTVDMLYAGVLNRDYERLSKKLNKASGYVARSAYQKEDEIL